MPGEMAELSGPQKDKGEVVERTRYYSLEIGQIER